MHANLAVLGRLARVFDFLYVRSTVRRRHQPCRSRQWEARKHLLIPYVSPSGAAQPRSPMYVFGQQGGEEAISLAQASRFVFSKQSRFKRRTFAVLSPTGNGRFRKCHTDSHDNLSITTALRLPSASRFITRDNSKRLKLIAPTTILEEARSETLQAVIAVS